MLALREFFEGMSKSMLRDVHAHAYGKKGLLNNALIQQEVQEYFSDSDRVRSIFSKMEPWQRRCLNLIYHSAGRGLSFNELRLMVPVSKNNDLQTFLLSMCREYVLWRSYVSGTAVYLGFSNFVDCFEIPPEETVDLSLPSVGFGNRLDFHVCMILALAKKGEIRINTNGTLHRRSRQICTEALSSAKKVCEKAAENEIVLVFSFLTQNGWLEQKDSVLYPSEKALDFLRKNGFRLHQDILNWWVKVRFHGDVNHCKHLLRMLRDGQTISEAAFLFWVMDPSYRILERNKQLSWIYLPRPLRELWLLGLVEFQMVGDKKQEKISAVVLSDMGREWLDTGVVPQTESNVSALPNFDLIATTGTSPRVLFILACLATVRSDDTFLCFNLSKETYLAGLKSGFPESEVEHFRSWINPPANVSATLEEWNATFYGARVRTVRLLKIDDSKISDELSKFAHFMECAEEYIPNYGFILKPECERRAFDILESFGYNPYVSETDEIREPAPVDEWRKEFSIGWLNAGAVDYDLKEEVDESSIQKTLNATKYGCMYQKLDTFDLVKVLRYVKTTGTLISAQVKDPAKRAEKEREITFFVHSLRLSRSPFNIEIQEFGTESTYPLSLNFIQQVKLLHKKSL